MVNSTYISDSYIKWNMFNNYPGLKKTRFRKQYWNPCILLSSIDLLKHHTDSNFIQI